MTEIPGVLSNPYLGPHKLGSMGCISPHPDPAIERPQVRVIDEEGNEMPVGEVGELVVKTPTLMQGYFNDPEQTAGSFKDGWFLTGDLVRRDDDEFLFFFTRKTSSEDVAKTFRVQKSIQPLAAILIFWNAHPLVWPLIWGKKKFFWQWLRAPELRSPQRS